MFNEKINFKISIGISIVIGGVVWISIAKNSSEEVTEYNESEALKNRLLGIFFAIIVSFLSSLRPI
jgi:drug/metabolite transporter (DMT)-like permease